MFTAQEPKEPDRVGRIIIEGNTETPDWFILTFVELRPGQVLRYPDLGTARKRLVALRHFDTDAPPIIEVIPNEIDAKFKDVRVTVKERPGAWVRIAVLEEVWEVAVLRPFIWGLGRMVAVVWLFGNR